jgi:hypothetical protein
MSQPSKGTNEVKPLAALDSPMRQASAYSLKPRLLACGRRCAHLLHHATPPHRLGDGQLQGTSSRGRSNSTDEPQPWTLMHRVTQSGKVWHSSQEAQLAFKLDALQAELQLPHDNVEDRLQLLLTLIPSLAGSLLRARVKTLAELLSIVSELPARMVCNQWPAALPDHLGLLQHTSWRRSMLQESL